MMNLKQESIDKNYPELKKVRIRTDEIFIRLELKKSEKIITDLGAEQGEGGWPTGFGWILKVGEQCQMYTPEDEGKKIRLKDSVDLNAQIDISSTSKPKMVRNPNAKFFTFKNIVVDGKERKHYVKYPTALVYEHEIAGSFE